MGLEEIKKKCENCIVRKINVLNSLKKEELKEISNSKTTRFIKKGDTLFKEGDLLSGVFCVRNGVTKLSKLSTSGNDQIVKLAGKGDVLGKRAIITDEPIDLKATAISDMEVCFIPKNKFLKPLKENINFTFEVLKKTTKHLKAADDVIANRSQKSAQQRLAKVLLQLKDTYGVNKNGDLNLVLIREDLAGLIGVTKESCIRLLSEFKKEQLVGISSKNISILDEPSLKKIISGKRYRN